MNKAHPKTHVGTLVTIKLHRISNKCMQVKARVVMLTLQHSHSSKLTAFLYLAYYAGTHFIATAK